MKEEAVRRDRVGQGQASSLLIAQHLRVRMGLDLDAGELLHRDQGLLLRFS